MSVKMKMLLRTSRVTKPEKAHEKPLAPRVQERREGGPSLMLRYSPGMGVRGLPLTSA